MRFPFILTVILSVAFCAVAPVGTLNAQNAELTGEGQHAESVKGQAELYSLEIVFSKKLRKRMATIDRVEQIREERFRRSLVDESNPYVTILGSPESASPDDGVDWAGAQLVPNLRDYGVENLVRSMVGEAMNRAASDFKGSIRLKLDRIKVDNHSVPFLRASNSYVIGKIEVRDNEGRKIIEDKMTVNLLIEEVEGLDYQGSDFAFAEADGSDRVGPVLAAFVQTALGAAWPEKKAQFPGVVMVRMAGPLISIRD